MNQSDRTTPTVVGYLALAPFVSGAERSLQCLLRSIQDESIRPVLFSPSLSPMHDWARSEGITSYALPLELFGLRSVNAWLKTQFLLAYYCYREGVNLLHSNQHWSVKPVNRLRRYLGLKLVTHFRDDVGENSDWWIGSGVDGSIFISQFMEQQALQHLSRHGLGDTKVIINPVTPSPYETVQASLQSREILRQRFGISSDEFVYAFLGQISPVKGLLELIHAFAGVSATRKRLVITGKPPPGQEVYYSECQKCVSDLKLQDVVTFLGFVDNPGEVYTVADVVVLPSHSEPLGRVPLEAAAHFRPTIATHVGGLPETILPGKTGWLVMPNDPVALSAALNHAATVDVVCMGPACGEWAQRVASPASYARTVAAFYRDILNN